MNDDYFAQNVKKIMEQRGITQDELAQELYMNVNHLNEKLNNKRSFSENDMTKIANILGMSISFLKSGNIDFNMKLEKIIDNEQIGNGILPVYFPYVENDDALKNDFFLKAYKIHKKISEFDIPNNDDSFEKLAYECYQLYKKSYDEGIIEGLINMLSVSSMYKYIINTVNINSDISDDDFDKLSEFSNLSSRKQKDIISKLTVYSDFDKQKKAKNYIAGTTDEVFELFKKLREHAAYKDLLDYYLAILSLFNLIDISFNESDNATFGSTYMLVLDCLGNEYAANYIMFNEKMIEDGSGFVTE